VVASDCSTGRQCCTRSDSTASSRSAGPCAVAWVLPERFAAGHFEARAEVGIDNRAAAAGSSRAPCKVVARKASSDNTLEDNTDSRGRSVAGAAGRSSREDMSVDSASAGDAVAVSSRAAADEVRNGRAVAVQCHLLRVFIWHYERR
jgi:hypothetical protein